jgi:histidinol-phosphate aminotransferase
MDLTWTGSQFLDPARHTDEVLAAVDSVDLTNKDEVWAQSVATAVAGYFGVPAPFVRVAAGATQLIEVLLRSLHRGLVVDVVPNFHLAATVSRQEEWAYRGVPVREPAELLRALEPYLDRSDAVFSLSSPRNPLGYQFELSDISTLLDRAKGVVILDEVYADFADDSALRLLSRYPNLFVVRTFSKAWGLANLRVGFAASAALADTSAGGLRLRLLPNSVSGVAQRAVRHLLARPGAVRASIAQALQARDRMSAALDGLPGLRVWPSGANYLCVETPIAAQVTEALAGAGYTVRLVHDLRGYPRDWPAGIRLAIPPQPHLDAVVACVRACHPATAAPTQALR